MIERAFAASRRFHPLPIEQTLALRLDDNYIGYLPIDASIQGASAAHKATRPNQNESFFVTHDRGPDHPDVIAGKPLRGRNRWPPGLPGLRADMMAYFDALRAMCDRMLPAFAMALGLPPQLLRAIFRQRSPRQSAFSALSAAGYS
jgi:isopenicillin N synthase-like dioxygenase